MHTTYPDFFRHHPALLYGISTLLGVAFALNSFSYFYLFIIAFLITLPLLMNKGQIALRCILAILFGFSAFMLTHLRYQFPDDPFLREGIAIVDIEGVSNSKTPFGSIWKYKGTLNSYIFEGQNVAKGIPVLITVLFHKYNLRPLSGFKYQFQASLKSKAPGKYILKPLNNHPWHMISHLNSLSELRYQTKTSLKKHLENNVVDPHVREFLTGIVTGEFDDAELSFELSRFGLQHLTAISGLHFSIFSALIGFILCLFLPRSIAFTFVISLMTLYFIFLGTSPSVTRAFATITIALAALIIQRQSLPLNSFGIALIITLLINPLALYNIGFQFSFGVTLSILLWNTPCDHLLKKVFPNRILSHAIKMPLVDQHGLLVLHYLRQALSLSFAVNFVALPLTLYHFHKFQVMGLLYNLFFPALITICLFLLILALIFNPFFSSLTHFIHALNEYYTKSVLNLGFYFPKSLDNIAITTLTIPNELMLFYIFSLFFLGALFKHRSSICETAF